MLLMMMDTDFICAGLDLLWPVVGTWIRELGGKCRQGDETSKFIFY